MLTINSASKSAGQEEKRNGQMLRQPLREHELFGLPKSTGKKDAFNRPIPERPLLQPVRIKDLFESMDSTKKSRKTTIDRRMTTVPNATSHFRRKLYESSKDQASPGNPSTIAFNGKKISESAHCQGLSKSEGKMKLAAHTSRPKEARSQNVRRKLYSLLHSSPVPTAASKTDRRHVAGAEKPKSQKSCIVDAKTMKYDSRKSTVADLSKASRRSRIPPPNTIRDKYTNNNPYETIKEETSLLSPSLESEARTMDCAKIPNDKKIDSNDANDLCKEQESPSNGDGVFSSCETIQEQRVNFVETTKSTTTNQSDKNPLEKLNEVSRPTVIMGIPAKGTQTTDGNESNALNKSNVPDSRLPLKELHENTSFRPERLGDANTSLEDLLGNSYRCERGESICYENLPRDSFLECTTSAKNAFVNVDVQTLMWMHGNLKQTVQSTEEHLFSMKQLLKTLEDVMKDQVAGPNEDSKARIVERKIDKDSVSPPATDTPIKGEENQEPFPEVVGECENQESAIDPPQMFCPDEVNVEASTKDREDSLLENDDRDKENCDENGEKPLRRSPRLMKKWSGSPKRKDDSFSLTEKELNIVYAQKTRRHDTPLNRKSANRIDPRCRRSVREYMALKSSINFLATPDVNGFLTPGVEKDTPSHSRMIRRSLSRKLLTELDDLYGESPTSSSSSH